MMTLRIALLLGMLGAAPPADNPYFAIEVVDEQTGRGVPLVELTTVNHIRLVTDSRGIAAFHEPGLMGQSVFFHVKSHGYEFPKDGFGYRGKALQAEAGGSVKLAIKRVNVAERLYRITGGGIDRDSLLVGRPVPLREPALNALVLGSDSVVNARLGGKLYWFWGDTNRPGYPLGNFHVPGATSEDPAAGGLDPEVGVDLSYFVDPKTGFAAETARLPGEGPTWIGGPSVLKADDGSERLFVHYVKVRPPMETYERGLARFDPATRTFTKVATFDLRGPLQLAVDAAFRETYDGRSYVVYATPFPFLRVPADPDALANGSRYEAFTCLVLGSAAKDGKIDRADDGSIRYGWKANTGRLSQADEAKLIESGALKPGEAILHLRDVETGKPVIAHNGSVYPNAYRDGRYVMIAVESFGQPSFLGEVWYAEADMPLGPWVYARKVVTHDKYSFYNPKHHPEFDKRGGRTIFFEGTYTTTFSGNTDPTPRYDYNQIMYKLDLDDPRMVLPVPVYEVDAADRYQLHKPGNPVAWFALDRPKDGAVPVFDRRDDEGRHVLRVGARDADDGSRPRFYALPAETESPPATTVPLYEWRGESGAIRYGADDRPVPGFARGDRPICRVWSNPLRVVLPAE